MNKVARATKQGGTTVSLNRPCRNSLQWVFTKTVFYWKKYAITKNTNYKEAYLY